MELPVGDPLTTPYASGNTLVAGAQTYDLGVPIMQVLDVPEGNVVITREAEPTGAAPTTLQLVRDDGGVATIDTGSIWSVRALPDPAGTAPTRLAWIWQAGDDGAANELRSAVLGDAASLTAVPGRFNLAHGFLGGDVLVSTMESETDQPDLAQWEPGADAVQPLGSGPSDDKIVHLARLGEIGATVVAWSGDDVVIRLASADNVASTPAPGGAWTYNPAYVGGRCSASTGACERLPHPIDAVEGAAY